MHPMQDDPRPRVNLKVERWPFALSELPDNTYLVGGWVRDRLLHLDPLTVDLDFVLPERPIEIARQLATRHGAGFVVLDTERQIARVVFAGATADFALQVGATLTDDLGRRDYSANAIAVRLDSPFDLIDPWHGLGDLQQRQLRAIARENLIDDPLRVLRGYRLAAKLDFAIEPQTRAWLQGLGAELRRVAAERVRTELVYLLGTARGAAWLKEAVADGALQAWLPARCLQLDRLARVEGAIAELVVCRPSLAAYFARSVVADRTVATVAKFAALVSAASALAPLGWSRAEQRWFVMLLRYWPKLAAWVSETPSAVEQYQLYDALGDTFPAVVALAIAARHSLERLLPWLDRWLDPADPIAHPLPLVTGDDLKAALHLSGGKRIGDLLLAIRLAQVEGRIHTPEEAIAFARGLGAP